jgi:hypothetical protein
MGKPAATDRPCLTPLSHSFTLDAPLNLRVSSAVTNTTHQFRTTRDLEDEVFMARIYAGFHYRHSLEQGFLLGHRVANRILQQQFRPLDE